MGKRLTNADGLPTVLTFLGSEDQYSETARKATRNIAIMVHNGELGTIDGWDQNLLAGYLDILGLRGRPTRRSAYARKLSGPDKAYQEELGR